MVVHNYKKKEREREERQQKKKKNIYLFCYTGLLQEFLFWEIMIYLLF
jgi:hypothetical protein